MKSMEFDVGIADGDLLVVCSDPAEVGAAFSSSILSKLTECL